MSRAYYVTLLIQVIYLLSLLVTVREELQFVNIIFGVALLLSLMAILYQKTKNKFFAYIAMLGFFIYMPIGIMGIVTVRNEMDKESKLKFLKEMEDE